MGMKRLSLLSVLFLISCGSAPERPVAHAPAAAEPAIELDDEPVATDEWADVLPMGSFPTIEALCAKQMEIVKPRVAETRANAMSVESEDGTPIAPSCGISDALKDARVSVSLPIRVLTAIDVETGSSTQTFLVAMTEQAGRRSGSRFSPPTTTIRVARRSSARMPSSPSR
jgi:hypothetical protein